jgi:tetratricopeptide (TPR) repeat protein
VAQLPGAAPGRLTSVPHSIEFSLRSPRLTEAGRRLFRLLGQLPAGIADVDRLVLLGGEALAAREEVQGLGLAFIRAGRLDLLPPVREHARREYDPPSDNEAWLRHYLSMIENLGTLVGTAGGIEAIQRLSPELPNIEAAVDRALGGVNLSAAVAASHGLSRTLRLTGLGSPRILIALAEACASSNDPTGEASCLKGLADLALIRSDLGVAWSTYEDALQLYRRVGDVFGEANCIRSQGEISLRREHYDAAYSQYEAAMWLFRRMGDVEGEGNCLLGLGNIAFSQSVYDVANAHYRAGLEYFRWNGSGHVVAEAGCLAGLGRVALANRDLKEARVHFEEALEMFERAQSVYNIALAHEDLASVTRGAEREFHIAVSKEHWSAMKLPENAAAVDARFRPPKKSLLSRIAGLLAIPTH